MHRSKGRSRHCRLLVLAAALCPLTVGCAVSLSEGKPEVLRYCRITVHSGAVGPGAAEARTPPGPPGSPPASGAQAGSTTTVPCLP